MNFVTSMKLSVMTILDFLFIMTKQSSKFIIRISVTLNELSSFLILSPAPRLYGCRAFGRRKIDARNSARTIGCEHGKDI